MPLGRDIFYPGRTQDVAKKYQIFGWDWLRKCSQATKIDFMNICFRFYIKSELCEIDFLKSREISCEVGQPILIMIIFIRMINFYIDQMILWNPGNSKFHVRSVSQAGRKKEEGGNGCQGAEEEGLPSIQEKNTITDTNICSI